MLLAPLKLITWCIFGLCQVLLAPLDLTNTCDRRSKNDIGLASTESQRADSKGGSDNGMKRNEVQAEQAHSTTGLYMECQARKFCQVHALNAMLGRRAVKLKTCCTEHAKDKTALGRNLRLNVGWSPSDGNFSDMVINAFLHYHSVPTTWLYPLAQKIPVGSKADIS